MKSLRLYHIYKGNQELNIGDKLSTILSKDDLKDYITLDWNFKRDELETLLNEISVDLHCAKQLGNKMCNNNLYITNNSYTILGIIPINHKKLQDYSYQPFTTIPDLKKDLISFSKSELEQFMEDNSVDSLLKENILYLFKNCVVSPSRDYLDGFRAGVTHILAQLNKLIK